MWHPGPWQGCGGSRCENETPLIDHMGRNGLLASTSVPTCTLGPQSLDSSPEGPSSQTELSSGK